MGVSDKMPSKSQYNLVQNDDYDIRTPLHTDEAFQHGITFAAKYIGYLDVPRPSSRHEIVSATRKVRYEYKAKGVKKKKVLVEVSVEGVRVLLRRKKKKKDWSDDTNVPIMHHPIYRIFYVSHDAQDLKVFSYIARDGSSNVFKCIVFKTAKKSQAMRVVRTVGQAFEVCHKLSIGAEDEQNERERERERTKERESREREREKTRHGDAQENDSTSTPEGNFDNPHPQATPPPVSRSMRLDLTPVSRTSPMTNSKSLRPSPLSDSQHQGPLVTHHELQLLREQLEQQSLQTQAALAQVHLLRDQLAAETSARVEAQTRAHHLLVHNKELLDHISTLVSQLHEQGSPAGQQSSHIAVGPQQHQLDNSPVSMYLPELQDTMFPYMTSMTVPGSPQTRQPILQHQNSTPANCNTLFTFPYTSSSPSETAQFQNQLLQRLQTLSAYGTAPNTPRSSQPLPTYPQLYPQSPNIGFRMSQASSYASSPVMTRPQSQPPQQPPQPSSTNASHSNSDNGLSGAADDVPFIRPLSQVGTLTTTDGDGRTRVIVPVPMYDEEEPRPEQASSTSSPNATGASPKRQRGNLASTMANMRLSTDEETLRKAGISLGPPVITRSSSEKVPHRSELMSRVQRGIWARHTTK